MAPTLENDLRNIAEWAEAAAGHHRNGLPREALMHGRNLGEAACRVIIRMAWPGRRGEDELRTEQFDLLVRTIQNKALAPPEIVSALHVLRTRGNNALHGKPVTANDSAGALFMLQALLEHLYVHLLHQRPPAAARAIQKALDGRPDAGQQDTLRDMLREVLREEIKVQEQRPPPAVDHEGMQRIEAAQEDQRARIRDMEELVRQLAMREAPAAETPEASVPPATPPRRRYGMAIAALLALLTLATYLFMPWMRAGGAAALPGPDSTRTTVLILPFALMQDDPNLNLRFEQAIEERLKARVRDGRLAMRVFVADTAIAAVPPEDSALAIARRHHADVIFYGELFEPTSADSGRVRIRFISPGEENWPRGDLGALGFRTLADSGAIRAQRAVQGIAELALAQRLYTAGKVSDALALLYVAPPVNADWTVTTHLMRARCHRVLRDLAPAMREMEAALALAPENAATLAFMGRILNENGDHAASIGYYEKAIAREPRNAPWLMALARLVGDRSWAELFDGPRVRELCARALEADSAHAAAWCLRGHILAEDGDHGGAQAAFEEAIRIDSTYSGAMYDLATLLLYHTRPPDERRAERLLRASVRLDSSDTRAVMLLAQVLTKGPDRDQALADRLYRKASAADPRQELMALAGRAKAAYEAHDDQGALDLYQQLWARDSSDLAVGVRIAVLLQSLGREPASTAMLLRCHALDSMHHGVNLNLGIAYLEPGTAPERKKAIRHLERALRTDPKDKHVLQRLGMALAEDGEFARVRPILERLLRVDPNDHIGNGYMGGIMMQLGYRQEAIQYFEKALITDPGDPIVCGNLATLYAALDPPRTADARALLQRALKELPEEPSLHMSMYSVLMQEGEFHRAAEHYRTAIAVKPHLRSASVEKKLADQGAW